MPVMPLSAVWFCILLAISGLLLLAGRWLGERGSRVSPTAAVAAFLLIALAAVPKFRPALLHTICPLGLSIWLEGVLAVFPWMLLVGVLWTGPFGKRITRVAPLMLVLGLIYFLFGGVWMIMPDIQMLIEEERTAAVIDGERVSQVTIQSRPDTCVPAACATALRRMGIETTEREMCHITMAKPWRGSTLARAACGLRHHLARRGIAVTLKDLSAEEVVRIAEPSRPVLVVIKSNIAANHMVVVLGRVRDGVVIANPSPGEHGGIKPMPIQLNRGYEMFTLDDFARLYRGGAIVFEDLPEPEGDGR
ncbi:MAG: hypothetical protein JSV91_09715 [Phycisphaerales bacterium]|nr:MAG: hypothetical protein JSV91_09715 [Phycisphaerales bacterium]